jgi:hypothetical protein
MRNQLLLTAVLALFATNTSANVAYKPEVPGVPMRRVTVNQALVPVDIGMQHAMGSRVVAESTVRVSNAAWLRLEFHDNLVEMLTDDASELVITSSTDGATQRLNARSLHEWQYTSAYFNGEEVTVSYISRAPLSTRVMAVTDVVVGEYQTQMEARSVLGATSICEITDRREPSTFKRSARMMPNGCTAWLIDDANHCFLSAGHCYHIESKLVMQFQVPASKGLFL